MKYLYLYLLVIVGCAPAKELSNATQKESGVTINIIDSKSLSEADGIEKVVYFDIELSNHTNEKVVLYNFYEKKQHIETMSLSEMEFKSPWRLASEFRLVVLDEQGELLDGVVSMGHDRSFMRSGGLIKAIKRSSKANKIVLRPGDKKKISMEFNYSSHFVIPDKQYSAYFLFCAGEGFPEFINLSENEAKYAYIGCIESNKIVMSFR